MRGEGGSLTVFAFLTCHDALRIHPIRNISQVVYNLPSGAHWPLWLLIRCFEREKDVGGKFGEQMNAQLMAQDHP